MDRKEYNNLKRLYMRAKDELERASDGDYKRLDYPIDYYEQLRAFVDTCEDHGLHKVCNQN